MIFPPLSSGVLPSADARTRRENARETRALQLARVGLPADQRPAANGLARSSHPVSHWLYLRLSFSRPSSGFFAVAAIPAARSFAIRSMSFTGTGLVRGNWTVPFRSS